MSPNRRITNYRSCLTETVYDPGRKTFAEAAVPHPFLARPSNSKMSLARSTTGCAPAIRAALARTRSRVRDAHATHLGYPYNLLGRSELPADIWRYLINNLGDPYAGSHFGSEVCDLERDAVAWLMDLWDCDRAEDFWGSVGASGTEGNLWALYLAREALPDARLLYGAEAHYSIPKAARILRIDAAPVACSPDGAIGLDALSAALSEGAGRPVILALTCGTTVKGAHDDIAEAVACLDAAGVDPTRRFIHVDGALNAMVIPFIDDAPSAIRPSFRHGVDSISTSGHKMIGTPMPCGVLVARRGHVDRVASSIAYLRSNDTTLMGSRSGHAVLAIWSRLLGHGAGRLPCRRPPMPRQGRPHGREAALRGHPGPAQRLFADRSLSGAIGGDREDLPAGLPPRRGACRDHAERDGCPHRQVPRRIRHVVANGGRRGGPEGFRPAPEAAPDRRCHAIRSASSGGKSADAGHSGHAPQITLTIFSFKFSVLRRVQPWTRFMRADLPTNPLDRQALRARSRPRQGSRLKGRDEKGTRCGESP